MCQSSWLHQSVLTRPLSIKACRRYSLIHAWGLACCSTPVCARTTRTTLRRMHPDCNTPLTTAAHNHTLTAAAHKQPGQPAVALPVRSTTWGGAAGCGCPSRLNTLAGGSQPMPGSQPHHTPPCGGNGPLGHTPCWQQPSSASEGLGRQGARSPCPAVAASNSTAPNTHVQSDVWG